MSEFDDDTAVARADGTSFDATITDRWNTFAGPNGGYVLAIATRALEHTLSKPHPLSVSAHFTRPPQVGPARVEVEIIKEGKRHSTGLARVTQDGGVLLTVIATFADLDALAGRTLILNTPPELPAPADAMDPMAHIPAEALPTIAERIDTRIGVLPGWARGTPSGDPAYELWLRFADGRAPDPLSLVLLADAVAPTVFELGELITSTVEMSVHVRARPRSEWLACRVRARHIQHGYHEEDMELWDGDTLVAQSRQLAKLAG